jgi:hypothetical protein
MNMYGGVKRGRQGGQTTKHNTSSTPSDLTISQPPWPGRISTTDSGTEVLKHVEGEPATPLFLSSFQPEPPPTSSPNLSVSDWALEVVVAEVSWPFEEENCVV